MLDRYSPHVLVLPRSPPTLHPPYHTPPPPPHSATLWHLRSSRGTRQWGWLAATDSKNHQVYPQAYERGGVEKICAHWYPWSLLRVLDHGCKSLRGGSRRCLARQHQRTVQLPSENDPRTIRERSENNPRTIREQSENGDIYRKHQWHGCGGMYNTC